MRSILSLALAALVLASCTKDDAEPRTHPLQANMVGQTSNFKVKADEWEEHGTPGDDAYGYQVRKNAHLLTEGIMENGTVHLYVQRGAGNWLALPVQAHAGGPEDLDWNFTYEVGHVYVQIDRNGEAFDAPSDQMTFRLVVFSE
jgi:hypothetical protein